MPFVLKEGQGALFRNDKEGNEARPDYRGEMMIGGTMYRLSGWIKDGAKGKWMSLKAEIPQEKRATPPKVGKPIDPDEDVPFN